MYDSWDVDFHTTGKNRSPCDRLYRSHVLASGAVGCPDVFSNAFSAALNIDMNLDFLDFASPSTTVPDTVSSHFVPLSTPPKELDGDQQWQCPTPTQSDFAPPLSLGPRQRFFVSTPDIWVFHDPAASPSAIAELSRIKSEDRNAHLLSVGALEPVLESIPVASTARNIPALTITKDNQEQPAPLPQARQPSSLLAPPSSPPHPPKRRNTPSHLAANSAAAKRNRKLKKASHQRLEDECVSLRECIDVKTEEVSGLAMELMLLKQEVWKCTHCHQRYLAALQGRG